MSIFEAHIAWLSSISINHGLERYQCKTTGCWRSARGWNWNPKCQSNLIGWSPNRQTRMVSCAMFPEMILGLLIWPWLAFVQFLHRKGSTWRPVPGQRKGHGAALPVRPCGNVATTSSTTSPSSAWRVTWNAAFGQWWPCEIQMWFQQPATGRTTRPTCEDAAQVGDKLRGKACSGIQGPKLGISLDFFGFSLDFVSVWWECVRVSWQSLDSSAHKFKYINSKVIDNLL